MNKEIDYLVLKWGTLKAFSFHTKKALKLLEEYNKLGTCISRIFQKDTDKQKEIICKLIDEGNFKKVYLDWDGKFVTKHKAKKYIMSYNKHE